MKENNEEENKDGESNEGEATYVLLPENAGVSATEVLGKIYVGPEDDGNADLTAWAKNLPRDKPTNEKVELYIDDDHFTVGFGGAAEISVPLSMVEELITLYRERVRARFNVTS